MNRLLGGIAAISYTSAQKEVQRHALHAAISLIPGNALRHLAEAGTGFASAPTTLSHSTAAQLGGGAAACSVAAGSVLMTGGVVTTASIVAAPVLVPVTILFLGGALLLSLFD